VVRVKTATDTALGWALVVLMGAAVVNVLWQVFTRFVVGNPSSFTDELARYLLIWVGLLGAAYAGGQRMHLAIDLLPTKLKGRARHALGVFIEACVFAFALFVMVIGGMKLVSLTLLLGQTSAALQLPLGYVYLVLPLCGLLLMFYAGLFMAEHVRQFLGHPPLLPESMETPAEAFAESVDDAGHGSEDGASASRPASPSKPERL
jgi:TRAP-type C4-dicarboxylate transport system permease small subunit